MAVAGERFRRTIYSLRWQRSPVLRSACVRRTVGDFAWPARGLAQAQQAFWAGGVGRCRSFEVNGFTHFLEPRDKGVSPVVCHTRRQRGPGVIQSGNDWQVVIHPVVNNREHGGFKTLGQLHLENIVEE